MSALGVVMPVFFRDSAAIPKVHCTLIYLGEEGSNQPARKPVEVATERLRSQCSPMMVNVLGVEVFGKGHVTALILEPRTLTSYRQFLERELRRDGIVSASEYSYRPHVTINKHDFSEEPIMPWPEFRVPSQVWIDRPTLWWGSENKNL